MPASEPSCTCSLVICTTPGVSLRATLMMESVARVVCPFTSGTLAGTNNGVGMPATVWAVLAVLLARVAVDPEESVAELCCKAVWEPAELEAAALVVLLVTGLATTAVLLLVATFAALVVDEPLVVPATLQPLRSTSAARKAPRGICKRANKCLLHCRSGLPNEGIRPMQHAKMGP